MSDETLIELGSTSISDSAPAGENIRYEPEYDLLEEEIGKLTSPIPMEINWTDVVDTSTAILQGRSKDLTVACYLTRALLEKQGIEGLLKGFKVIKGLIDHFWEPMFPPVKRLRARAGAINWLGEQIVHPLEKANPSLNTSQAFKDLYELILEVEKSLDELMGKEAPNIIDARNVLKGHVEKIKYQEKLKADEDARRQKQQDAQAQAVENAAATTDSQVGVENNTAEQTNAPVAQSQNVVSATTNVTAAPASVPQASSTISSNDDVVATVKSIQFPMRDLATYLRNKNLADPLSYSLVRQSTWAAVTQLPMSENGVTPLQEVMPDQLQEFKTLQDSGNLHALIPAVEQFFCSMPFWLDAHRIVATALEALGKDYMAARRAVVDETASFILRFPGINDLKFNSGTPFADDVTQMWIQNDVLSGNATDGDQGQGGKQIAPWDAVTKKAQTLASKGKFEDGIKLLREGMASAASLRERAYWELQQAGFCAKAGHYAVAISQLEHLDDLVIKLGLEEWEPELSLEIARVYLLCHDKLLAKKDPRSGEELARAATLKKRMCRLDVLSALSNTRP